MTDKDIDKMVKDMFNEIGTEKEHIMIPSKKPSILYTINFYISQKIIFPVKMKIYSFYLNILEKIYCR